MQMLLRLQQAQRALARSVGVFVRDTGHGLLEVSHNSLALLGLVVIGFVVFAAGREDVRHQLEGAAFEWLQTRLEARTSASLDVLADSADGEAVLRATALDPSTLPKEQAHVARWIARKYHVAQEPVSRLVQESWAVGRRVGIDPTLILAVMAVESSFNPFAQSTVGAQGLMQVMTRVHDAKYEAFGGIHAAFDPVSNLRVGVLVLRECIARAGNVHDGLRQYVGASAQDDGGYAGRVLAEQARMKDVAAGKAVPVTQAATASGATPGRAAQDDAAVDRNGSSPAGGAGTPSGPEQVALLR